MNKPELGGLPHGRAFEESENVGRNTSGNETLGGVIGRRLGRRDLLKGALAVTAMAAVASPAARLLAGSAQAATPAAGSFAFDELQAMVSADDAVAAGYDADVLIRWGDAVLPDAPAFDPAAQSADAQEKQFGYNNDYIGFLPLPAGSGNSDHGLLVVNHEYTSPEVMLPGVVDEKGELDLSRITADQAEIEKAAHGLSIIEIRRGNDGKWSVVKDSLYNRRISARSTRMAVSGPAAGHERLQTAADPSGTSVIGTLNNCAGGLTPWGTVLTAEENFHGYFSGELPEASPQAASFKRYGIPAGWYAWGRFDERFDVSKTPNEPNRFGWMVEIDPYDPQSTPVKRTALGRFKHEGAESIVAPDGRVVLYMGDDERFDYLYKFVTEGRYDPADPDANRTLLDAGTLYVARFGDDGSLSWLPLVHGEGPLTAENGFASQADILIDTRLAADRLGATKMDRPEDVSPNPTDGKVYVMLTNNSRRKPEQVDPANPRADNRGGHIIEISEPDGDFAATATASKWDILVLCGDPSKPDVGASWNPATTENGWFISPDNCVVDGQGRLWVSTDGNSFKASGRADGIWAMETKGELRGTGKHFYRVPVGAEMCGPFFTADDRTLFVAVQHPGEGGSEWPEFGRASTFADPSTRWPDFEDGMPPRPSIVVISKQGGGKIGV